MQVWVTSDGTEFTKLGEGRGRELLALQGARGRLVLAVLNPDAGVQIWVSEDGELRQVPVDGLCVPGNYGMSGFTYPVNAPVSTGRQTLCGHLESDYGVRFGDGRRPGVGAGRRGLGLAQQAPLLVYKDRLYVLGCDSAGAAASISSVPATAQLGSRWSKTVSGQVRTGTLEQICSSSRASLPVHLESRAASLYAGHLHGALRSMDSSVDVRQAATGPGG